MLNIDRIKTVTIFALTLLIGALLLANLNVYTSAQQPNAMNLHGPSLTPIHMHSNITLTPIHMHHMGGILWPGEWPITQPNCTTDWQKIDVELEPFDFEYWHLSSWEDNGEPFGELSQNDQIDMYNWDNDTLIEWFHVDRMTLTLQLSGPFLEPWHIPDRVTRIMELKQPYCNPYDPYVVYDPLGSLWSQVWPVQQRDALPLMIWIDDPSNLNGRLDVTDSISFDNGATWWHVEDIATDLILRWKMMDPIGTFWHELYPDYCEWYEMTSWSSYPDPYCDRISNRDTIDMLRLSDTSTHWYFVDRVTLTINVTDMQTMDWMMLELKTLFFEEMYHALKKPINSTWHAVYPEDVYCTVFKLTFWDPIDPIWDNCNGVLDPCDYIQLQNLDSGLSSYYHITDIAYDIILNEYITDPVGTDWNEIAPDGTLAEYTVIDFEDNNQDIWLSPCDNVTLADPTGFSEEYHVENVTLTLNLTILDVVGFPPFVPQDRVYLEHIQLAWNYSWPRLYHPKIEPWDTDWLVVNPVQHSGLIYTFDEWVDNCNGVIDYCDTIYLYNVDGGIIAHVDEIAVDIVVQKSGPAPPPPPWYKKPPYPDYAPSGIPDFDQKQDAWGPGPGIWTWCGPVAVANSLWWFDSKYDPSNLITAYPGVPDDHHVRNVDPLVRDLASLMDTDDSQPPFDGHTGTYWQDMAAGIDAYLKRQGVNDTLEVHSMEFPNFFWIEDEIYRCQDVVLLLEFWVQDLGDPNIWYRFDDPYDVPGGSGGHYVTCAGVNSTTFQLLIADPFFDAAEAGFMGDIPVTHPGHGGDPTVHNDTQYVSHDGYVVAQWIEPPQSPYPGQPIWELVGYLQQNMGYPPNFLTFIKAAVVTSPLAEHDVAVIDVTTSKTGCLPMATVGKNYNVSVNVTVENQGGFAETFNVTAYADSTSIGSSLVALNPGDNLTIAFTWDTTGFAYGNYTISATADTVPGETDTADNTLIDGTVLVTLPGDVDGDQDVDIYDIVRMSGVYGVRYPSPRYDPNCDMDDDGDIDIYDIVIAAGNYGKSY